MKLHPYWLSLNKQDRTAFATACDTTVGYLDLVARGHRKPGASLGDRIEINSKKKVTRKELRSDWRKVWPMLSVQDKP